MHHIAYLNRCNNTGACGNLMLTFLLLLGDFAFCSMELKMDCSVLKLSCYDMCLDKCTSMCFADFQLFAICLVFEQNWPKQCAVQISYIRSQYCILKEDKLQIWSSILWNHEYQLKINLNWKIKHFKYNHGSPCSDGPELSFEAAKLWSHT